MKLGNFMEFISKNLEHFYLTFLGHLSHSGDLLLWVGVRRLLKNYWANLYQIWYVASLGEVDQKL